MQALADRIYLGSGAPPDLAPEPDLPQTPAGQTAVPIAEMRTNPAMAVAVPAVMASARTGIDGKARDNSAEAPRTHAPKSGDGARTSASTAPVAVSGDTTARLPVETTGSALIFEAEVAAAQTTEARTSDAPRAADPTHRPADPGPRAAQQVAVALAMNPDGRIELALDPEELGPVRLALTPGDGTMTVHLAADRAETLDMLRRHTDILARELRQAGYGDVTFRFGSETPAGGHHAPRHGYDGLPSGNGPSDTTLPDLAPAVATFRPMRGAGGLDLRL